MDMKMRVRLPGWIAGFMAVQMRFIVDVGMRMHLRLMDMLVFVSFRHMQPYAPGHEQAACNKLRSH